MAEPILSVKELVVDFEMAEGSVRVIDGISFDVFPNEVLCIAWHPTKPVLAAGAWDKTVKVWDLTETGKDK